MRLKRRVVSLHTRQPWFHTK